ncbi:SAR2788 family putative toxin [Halalkalibacter sp. APA_J-10(15)]|uniref:SAR2788 family putative toxin n=1 Tax=Halalkalibacter sp. APA_J-10(15) TaxID=2933805 RepID=UPI001FF60346|nr:SAR2788 family putative toxin [Halalkalibacter sp. APA_J-10(15)]MCK0470384.1 SAR2788 family putative toxin [Halalkalibacter sp. APA_J-10(15)]
MIKKISSFLVVFMILLPLYDTVNATNSNKNIELYDENVLYDDLEEVKEEVLSDENLENAEELDFNLGHISEGSLEIEIDYITEGIEVENVVQMDTETEDLHMEINSIIDGEEVQNNFIVKVEEIDGDLFKAIVKDLDTGEEFKLNTEELQASILPAVIVGAIIRLGARVAISLYTRSQLIRALTAVTFSTSQLQKKFKHAASFGIRGSYSKKNAAAFEAALRNHIGSASHVYSTRISGQSGRVILHLKGNLGVFVDQNGKFITAYKLTTKQINHHRNVVGELILRR